MLSPRGPLSVFTDISATALACSSPTRGARESVTLLFDVLCAWSQSANLNDRPSPLIALEEPRHRHIFKEKLLF